MLETGNILQNRYKIIGLEKTGGYSTVYKAEHTILEIPYAIKELGGFQDPKKQESAFTLFKKEAKTLASLNHPMVIRMVDFFSENNNWYLVMEFVCGETFAQILDKSEKPLGEARVSELAVTLCEVLDYLHSRVPPVIFRDINPSNIMLAASGGIKLIDFGLSREYKAGVNRDTSILATPGYAPPEQYGKGQTDPRTDIYSLGVTMYALLTKIDPRKLVFMYTPVKVLNPDLSEGIAQIIEKCMSIDPQKRYQDVQTLKKDLLTGNNESLQ